MKRKDFILEIHKFRDDVNLNKYCCLTELEIKGIMSNIRDDIKLYNPKFYDVIYDMFKGCDENPILVENAYKRLKNYISEIKKRQTLGLYRDSCNIMWLDKTDKYNCINWLRNHIKHFYFYVTPDYIDYFKQYFPNVPINSSRVKIYENYLRDDGSRKKYTFSASISFIDLNNCPNTLLNYMDKQNRINNVGLIYNLLNFYDFVSY